MKKKFLISPLLSSVFLLGSLNAEAPAQEETNQPSLNVQEEKMNNEKLLAKWDKLVGCIKKQWGKLTDHDLEKVKGKKDQLIALIKEKYADSQEEFNKSKEAIEKKILELLNKIN